MEQVKNNGVTLQEKLKSGEDYYEVRLESIGGLGANLCGKMLGELGLKYLDINSSSFSSYGSEKTGTPVKAFIRYCKKEKEIREHSPVEEPDLLVVFHQALLKDESVYKDCGENTSIIIALDGEQEKIQGAKVLTSCNCFGIEAQRMAMETHSRINMVMFGAALRIMGLENLEAAEQICKDTLGKKYPDALAGNLEGVRRGYESVRRIAVVPEENQEVMDKPEWGYRTAPIGGINPRIGSTVLADLSPSRQGFIPLFLKERCINCGQCHATCPDMVFQFVPGEYKGRAMMVNQGLDYYHCKGCLRCVDICPVNALVRGVEAEHPDKEYFMANQELIVKPKSYEKAGPDGYITSESYLTEKRMEGGEV